MYIDNNSFNLDGWWLIHLLVTILLSIASMFVVLSNSLVVSAISSENQLHSVTNYLIASLAVADCLVGLVVMPFSILSEIYLGFWSFGPTWCDLWHSFDVLASTASIMNLCAISLDRYLAITDPISYPARMTPKRVALLIVSLWTCSALISFPAIIWWRSVGKGSLQIIEIPSPAGNTESFTAQQLISISTLPKVSDHQATSSENYTDYEKTHKGPLYKCVFTDDTYYLLFSSFISFYGPLCVMLYAYYRIYKAAVKQTRFLKHGSKQVTLDKSDKNGANNFEPQQMVLRAHRGGGGSTKLSAVNNKTMLSKQCSSLTINTDEPHQHLKLPNQEQHLQSSLSLIDKSNEKTQMLYFDSGKLMQSIVDLGAIEFIDKPEKPNAIATRNIDAVTDSNNSLIQIHVPKESTNSRDQIDRLTIDENNNHDQVQFSDSEKASSVTRQHKGVGRKLSRLAKERKAAKTLGIVVGVFILCWLPYFVVNIINALYGPNYIYRIEILFPVVTWLGYLNSAMNPVIYACWSRDFRRAFRKVLCSWIEFLCPYKQACLARKLNLKKKCNSQQQQHLNQESYLTRNLSSVKGKSSSIRAGVSSEVRGYVNSVNGNASQGLLSEQHQKSQQH